MIRATTSLVIVVILLLTARFDQAFGQSLSGAPTDPDPEGIARLSDDEVESAPKNLYMVTKSTPGNASIKRGCSVAFDFDTRGHIEDLRLMRSSGIPEVDFDCISAVLGSAPYEPNERGIRKEVRLTFGGRDCIEKDGVSAINKTERAHLKESYAQKGVPSADYFICNSIPLSIFFRYPGLFKEEELCDYKNLRIIHKAFFSKNNEPTFEKIVSNPQFKQFYEDWYDFVSKNAAPTKEQIEKFRDGLDGKFADMLATPPSSISKR